MNQSESYTHDSISLRGAGVVTVVQQKKGSRFTLDSILLADFCRIKKWDHILEPGTGTGVISLLLARKHPRSRIVAVDIQPASVRLCRRNISENNLEDKITLLEQDLRTLKTSLKASTFDVIVANPPYGKAGAGKQAAGPERVTARQDRFGNIDAWLDLQVFLRNKGLYVLVFPVDRLADLTTSLRSRKLEPKRMRFVHPYADKPASVALMEAVKGAGTGLQVLPPLIVHEPGGRYTAEMLEIYSTPGIVSLP